MTALDRYVRLESDGLWRPGPDEQRRQVTISFGDATLVIADGAARPLAHWSLPALIRLNTGERPALYAPDDEASEELEIADDIMIDAIEEVRKALAKSRPQPGKLRHWITAGVIVLAVALAVFWLPGALMRQTLAVLPTSKRVEIGATMLAHIQTKTGQVCRDTTAQDAAGKLAARIFGAGTALNIVVVPDLPQGALAVPGGLIVLDAGLLQAADDPAAVAGFVLASRAAIGNGDTLEPVLQEAGLAATFGLLTTGDLPREVVQRHADDRLANPAPDASISDLRQAFAAADLPYRPYLTLAAARNVTPPDLGQDPLDGQATPPIMTDSEWISLQNICNN
ncbi:MULTISPECIES: hypothetical protein [unclassified Yoonia]|uniref:hypothetical protein n=1 Tax=unclassified Yoonia TaxID=2629118 RepID=UPI002AFEAADC|nr:MULTISPECIES: hypothetical protein [unclassified Yoonia]